MTLPYLLLICAAIAIVGGRNLVVAELLLLGAVGLLARELSRIRDRLDELESGVLQAATPTPEAPAAGPAEAPAPAAPTPPPAVPVYAQGPALATAVATTVTARKQPAGRTATPATRRQRAARGGPATAPLPAAEPVAAPSGPSALDRLVKAVMRAVGPSGSSADAIEAWFSGRLLAVVGGAALLIGALFFLSLAFSRGWISEPIRVAIGIAAGVALLGIAVWLMRRQFEFLGNVLVAVGLAVLSLAMYAAAPLYHLVDTPIALVGSFVATIAAAIIAIRFASQVVAVMAVVSVLASPPILGAAADPPTVAYLGLALVGTTAMSIFRGWRWLPPVAFVLSLPQLAAYVFGDPDPVFGSAAVLAYWALYAVAAGGEEWRVRRRELSPSAGTLLLGASVVAIAGSFAILDGPLETWRAPYLVVLAVAHAVLAGLFLRREGDRHAFGLLAAATAVAVFSIALPLQYGASVIPIAWSAEAAALAWVGRLRRHEYAALGATVLGIGAIAYVATITYPWLRQLDVGVGPYPFTGSAGLTLGFVLGAMVVAGAVSGLRLLRIALAAAGAGLIAIALPHELESAALVAGWSVLFAACLIAERAIVRQADEHGPARSRQDAGPPAVAAIGGWPARLWSLRPPEVDVVARRSLVIAGLITLGLAVIHIVAFDYPFYRLGGPDSAVPFAGPAPIAALAVLFGLGFVGAIWRERAARAGVLGFATLVVAYVLPFELSGPALVASWVALCLASLTAALLLGVELPAVGRHEPPLVLLAAGSTLVAGGLAVLHAVALELSPGRVVSILGGRVEVPAVPFVDAATMVAVTLAGGIIAAWAILRWAARRPGASIGPRWTAAWPALVPIGAIAGWLALLELPTWLAIDAIAGVAVAAAFVAPRLPASTTALRLGAGAAVAAAAFIALAAVAPPTRLSVTQLVQPADLARLATSATAFVGIVAAMLVAARWQVFGSLRRQALLFAGAVAVYGLSVALVDAFQLRVTEPIANDEIRKQASVALTVLWAACGGVAFGFGLWREVPYARYGGLALLGLATTKAFLVDLAGLDVAYRVLSFVGLGILLLASAFVAQRVRRARPQATPGPTGNDASGTASNRSSRSRARGRAGHASDAR